MTLSCNSRVCRVIDLSNQPCRMGSPSRAVRQLLRERGLGDQHLADQVHQAVDAVEIRPVANATPPVGCRRRGDAVRARPAPVVGGARRTAAAPPPGRRRGGRRGRAAARGRLGSPPPAEVLHRPPHPAGRVVVADLASPSSSPSPWSGRCPPCGVGRRSAQRLGGASSSEVISQASGQSPARIR